MFGTFTDFTETGRQSTERLLATGLTTDYSYSDKSDRCEWWVGQKNTDIQRVEK